MSNRAKYSATGTKAHFQLVCPAYTGAVSIAESGAQTLDANSSSLMTGFYSLKVVQVLSNPGAQQLATGETCNKWFDKSCQLTFLHYLVH